MRVFTLVTLVVLLMKSPVLALENMGPQAREFIREVSSMSTLDYQLDVMASLLQELKV